MEIVQSRRGSVLSFIAGVLLGVITTAVVAVSLQGDAKTWSAGTTVDYTQQLGLFGVDKDGTVLPTGLEVPSAGAAESWIHPYMVVSPQKDQVAYMRWQDSKMKIFVSHLDGSNAKEVATQIVSVGHGELVKASFGWADDGKSLFYQERSSVCGDNGQAVDGVPYPYDCNKKQYTMYKVNVANGAKEVADRTIW